MLLQRHDLVDRVIEGRNVSEGGRILRIERPGHVDAVEPHLVRIDELVPEAARARARLSRKLLAQERNRLPETRVAAGLVQRKQQPAGRDLVQVVIGQPIGRDAAVLLHEAVHVLQDRLPIARLPCPLPHLRDRVHEETVLVVPAHPGDRVARQRGVGHAHRPERAIGGHIVC